MGLLEGVTMEAIERMGWDLLRMVVLFLFMMLLIADLRTAGLLTFF